MIFDAICGSVLWVVSFFCGTFLLKLNKKNLKNIDYVSKSFLGFTFFLVLSFIGFYLENNNLYLNILTVALFINILIALLGIKYILSKKVFSIKKIIYIFNSIIIVLIFAFLMNSTLLDSRTSIRNGPDTIGMVVSGNSICNSNPSILENTIINELSIKNIDDALQISNQKSIYSIPNYNLQVYAEFVLGAKRIGLINLTANLCKIFGQQDTIRIYNSIMVFTIINFLVLIYILTSKFNFVATLISSWIFIFQLGFISVYLEGGIGQTLAAVYLILLLYQYKTTGITSLQFNVCFLMLTIYAITSYAEIIPLLLLILFYSFYISIRTKRKNKINYLVLFLFFINLSLTWTSIKNRLFSRSIGGWDQGRAPTIIDMFGLFNWLPDDGYSKVHSNWKSQLVLYIIVFLIGYIVYKRISNKLNITLFLSLLIYLIFFFDTYYVSFTNNYRLWKLSGYFVIIFIAVILELLRILQVMKIFRIRFFVLLALTIIIMNSLHTSYQYLEAWMRNKSSSFDTRNQEYLKKVIQGHDIRIVQLGQKGLRLLLVDDIYYYNPSRGFNIEVKRKFMDKPLLYFVDTTICKSSQICKLNLEKSTYVSLISNLEGIDIYSNRFL